MTFAALGKHDLFTTIDAGQYLCGPLVQHWNGHAVVDSRGSPASPADFLEHVDVKGLLGYQLFEPLFSRSSSLSRLVSSAFVPLGGSTVSTTSASSRRFDGSPVTRK